MSFLAAACRYLKRFLLFWRNFLIGDDWWGAALVFVGLAATYVAARYHVAAYWILPLFVVASLTQSLWRMKRKAEMPPRRDAAQRRAS